MLAILSTVETTFRVPLAPPVPVVASTWNGAPALAEPVAHSWFAGVGRFALSASRNLLWALLLVAGYLTTVDAAEVGFASDKNVPLDDVQDSFDKIVKVSTMPFGGAQARLPEGGHLQGIQTVRGSAGSTAFITRSSNTLAMFFVIHWSAAAELGQVIHQQRMPSDGRQPPLRHPGGCQIIGDFLVVGVEDNQEKLRSEIQFWNVSKPRSPGLMNHLTIKREGQTPKDKTAGAVGIVKRRGRHLLAVANWDAAAVDFYESNGLPLADLKCRFRFLDDRRWIAKASDRSDWQPDQIWGEYQSINLIEDREGRVFLVGFDTDSDQHDVADLYQIDETGPSRGSLRKLRSKQLHLNSGVRFQAGAGIGSKSATDLEFYATQYDLQRDSVIAIAR